MDMDQDPFLIMKWNHAFSIFFDINQNNELDWEDFEMLIERIKLQRGEDSEDHKLAQTAMKDIWNGLVTYADLNKDNKVSLDEWQQMWNSVCKEKLFPEWQEAYLKYMFHLLDSSGDDLIDYSEYIEVMKLYGIPSEQASDSFDKFAIKDGRVVNAIDFATFARLYKDYFMSNDKEALGNNLFGALL